MDRDKISIYIFNYLLEILVFETITISGEKRMYDPTD